MSGPIASTLGVGVDKPDVVYAGLSYPYGGGVLRSTDRGQHWTEINTGLPRDLGGGSGPISIGRVIVDPRNADVVFALTEGGVYKTVNAGGQWTSLNQGIQAVALRSVALDPQTYTLYGTSDTHLYYLLDGGQTWQERESYPIPQPASFPEAPKLALDLNDHNRFIVYNDNGLYVGLPERNRALLPEVIQVSLPGDE